jgi:hypothetical protein
MASHYLFEPEFCNPASGWEKGQVEKNVQDARRRLWQPMPAFPDLDALNAWLEALHRAMERRSRMAPCPARRRCACRRGRQPDAAGPSFDGFVEHTKRVSPTCLVHFERNRYSVPASFANRPVSLRIYPDRIVIAAEGRSCASMADHRAGASSARGGRSMTGGTIWRCPAQARSPAQRRALPEMPDAFRSCRATCSSTPAATGRWSRSWRWSAPR